MVKVVYLKNFRRGLATNSSSTHSIVYRNEDDMLEDMNVMEENFYDRFTRTVAASREAKIKYVLSQIYYDEALVEMMLHYYPEMKKYFPIIRKRFEKDDYEIFGSYCRGGLVSSSDGLEFNIKYLRNVIDNPELIIIGGSDEEGWVFDEAEKRRLFPIPSGRYDDMEKRLYRNGNYFYCFTQHSKDFHPDGVKEMTKEDGSEVYANDDIPRYCDSGRIRFSLTKDEPIPDHPELIDIKITDACEHGCPFCYMGATKDGKHGDGSTLWRMMDDSLKGVEFSVGGGNILLHPKLEEILAKLSSNGRNIVNVTIKYEDCDYVMKDLAMRGTFVEYVSGVGISITNVEQVQKVLDFAKFFKGIDEKFQPKLRQQKLSFHDKFVAVHIIPELIGAKETKKILDACRAYRKPGGEWVSGVPVLLLGYKFTGRGASQDVNGLTDEDFKMMFDDYNDLTIDTTFANRYYKQLCDSFCVAKTITLKEGEYSMFVDLVKGKAYKSSYQLEKGYDLKKDWDDDGLTINEAFNQIRKDNGFPVYTPTHYYDVKKK